MLTPNDIILKRPIWCKENTYSETYVTLGRNEMRLSYQMCVATCGVVMWHMWQLNGFSISTQLSKSCSVVLCSPQSVIVIPQHNKALRCVYSHHLLGQLIFALPQSLTSVNSSIRENCCAFIGFFPSICLRSNGVQDTFNIGASVWVCPTAFL